METPLDAQLPLKPEELQPWMFERIKTEEPTHESLIHFATAVFMWQDYAKAVEAHLKKVTMTLMELGMQYNDVASRLNEIHDILHREEQTLNPLAQFFSDAMGSNEAE